MEKIKCGYPVNRSTLRYTMDRNDMDRIDLKNMHSNELRELKTMIQEELNFRDDIGKEIKQQNQQKEKHE